MFFVKFLIFILFINFIDSWEDNTDLIVDLNDGKILGRYMTSESGLPVRAFLGIPYAQPPIGDLRFKSPQKVQPWNGIKKTQIDSPVCTQINPFARIFDEVTGQEDCLYLNVYTPHNRKTQKLPVIYWIHGGGWTRGEATNLMYGHEHLLDHDVIFVSGNYRVGPLGFLSTEDENAPGNFGLKDQSFILKWIQENIEHFGGDKNSVTIWGESAGGASVNYHMISPLSQGLFHRAISHSGTIMERWSEPARPGAAVNQANRLADQVGCPKTSTNLMVECLRNVPASNLTLAIAKLYYWDYDPVILFLPVVEDFETNEEKFISTRTLNSKSSEIPWIVGMNSEDGLLKMAQIIEDENFLNEMITKWDEILPYAFFYDDIEKNLQAEVTKAINKFYFGSENPSNFGTQSLIDMWTDGLFIGLVGALKQRFSANNEQNTFVYLFTHKGTASFSAASKFYGTSHVDDLIPFFPMHRNIFISSKPTSQDRELARILPKMWIDFAITGKMPTISNIPEWPVASSIPFSYMQIGNQNGEIDELFQVKTDFYNSRGNFWIELRANYSLNRWN